MDEAHFRTDGFRQRLEFINWSVNDAFIAFMKNQVAGREKFDHFRIECRVATVAEAPLPERGPESDRGDAVESPARFDLDAANLRFSAFLDWVDLKVIGELVFFRDSNVWKPRLAHRGG